VDVLCEGACVMHRYNQKPIEIGRLQRLCHGPFYGEPARPESAGGRARPHPPGGGVRGRRAGVARLRGGTAPPRLQVTIFDNRPLPGGLNTYGVAEYKLRPADSLREVEMVRSLGVEFRQAEVGDGVSLDDLERSSRFFPGPGPGRHGAARHSGRRSAAA
jgi:dihydropyrimidine dehydrogenase (NAD+) subunit PreT